MTCGSCHRGFPPNHELATIPDARRVAFDPARNRVWRVCHHCQHWNLLGPEASAAALVELEPRFKAGKISEFDGIAVAGIGISLELFRLTAVSGAVEASTPRIATRDDAAASRRKEELNQEMKGRLVLAKISIGAMLIATSARLAIFFENGFVHGAPLLFGALVVWSTVVWLFDIVWRNTYPDRPTLFLPWKQGTAMFRLLAAGFLTYSVHLIVAAFGNYADHGLGAAQLVSVLMVFNLLALAMSFAATAKEGPGRTKSKWWNALSLTVSVGVVVSVLWRSVTAMVLITVLVAVLAIMVRRAGRRKVIDLTCANGRKLELTPTQIRPLSFSWTDPTQEFTVHGLPDGTVLTGDDAATLVSKVLRWFHTALPPAPERTDHAWELIRTVGDARGVLAVLQGYQTDQSDRVPILTLPPTYRLALDMVLADSPSYSSDAPGQDVGQIRLAAESAAEIAEEAERLDRGE